MDIEVPGVNLRRTPRVSRRTMLVALVAALPGVGLAAFGIVSRQQAVANLQQIAAARAIPTVEVAAPAPRSGDTAIELPGRLEAYGGHRCSRASAVTLQGGMRTSARR